MSDWADDAAKEIVENIAIAKAWCPICEAYDDYCDCADNVIDRHVAEVGEHIGTALRAEQRGVERMRERTDKLEMMVGSAYQIISALAAEANRYDSEVERTLDAFAYCEVDAKLLPFGVRALPLTAKPTE